MSCATWLLAAGAVDHLGLGRAAVHDEGPGQAGADVGQPQADEVGVLAEPLVVAGSVGARGGRALGQDDHEHHKGGGQQRLQHCPVQGTVRQADPRQAARDRAEDVDPVDPG